MKKEVILLLILFSIVLLSTSILAQTTPTTVNLTSEEKAYSCLESRVTGKCSSLPFEDRAFALLALGHKQILADECKAAINPSRECWPSENCKVKDTAIGLLALNNVGSDISSAKDWILSKTKNPDKLLWYLQIDTTSNSTCKINYGDRDYTLKIGSDKKLTIGSNRCLKSSNYWLSIDKSCLDETFKVTCDADFVSSLLYKTATSNTYFISGSLESASANGFTQHKVASKCFSDTTTCDYLSSLWATFALSKIRQDINPYLPYLFAFAEENEKFAPYAFLYVFTAEDEYRQKTMNEQKTEGYWDFGSGKGKFYDTATAMFAFQTATEYGEVIDTVKAYLAGTRVQASDGCWGNSVRDTGFLLWTLWPKATTIQATQQECEKSGFYCMTEGECDSSGGNIKENFYCPGGVLKVCCDKPITLKLCSEQLGKECTADQPCTSSVVKAADTDECCLTECQAQIVETECESAGLTCKPSCSDTEEPAPEYECNMGDVCCKPKPVKEGISAIWIVLLIFLIALVVVGIIFRNRIKTWIHLRKGKAPPSAPAGRPRPPYPPYPPSQQRPMGPARMPARAPASREMEETLRKLKEMSK
jgi:hypothetical protein